MATVAVQPQVTPEAYLALERQSGERSEYLNGQVSAMTGASLAHNAIGVNVVLSLGAQLKGKPCSVYVADMRVKVSATGLYTYPDVIVVCGEPQLEDAEADTLLNPTVLIEVFSPSTEAYDRGEKFAHYRRLPPLQEYVLIGQDRVRVEHFARQGDQWVLTEVDDLTDSIRLRSIDCQLAIGDIYDKVLPARGGVAPSPEAAGQPA